MKNKNAKTPTDQLFFSKTWNFLNIYLVSQAGRSPATAESYRDSLTVFKNYLTGELGSPISYFKFSCTVQKSAFMVTGNIFSTRESSPPLSMSG